MATQRAAAGVSIDEQIAAIHRSKGLTSDSDSKIGPKIPQPQEQNPHPHHMQQNLQSHMLTQQHNSPIFPGYPSHNSQGAPGGLPPVTYSSYTGSSAPFSHQLPGYITPVSQGMTGQPSSARPPIPPVPQHFHRPPLPGMGMNPVNVPPPPMPPAPQSHQTPLVPSPSAPPVPPVKPGRLLEEENEVFGISKRTKLDSGLSVGALVPEEEWTMIHQAPVNVQVQCPTIPEKSEWNCHGQIIVLENLSLATLVSTVKDKIFAKLNFPAGKQKLTIGGAVMKNQVSLAYYNMEDGVIIGLAIKDRGKK
ncbi:4207_t:CDS:2 [Diversispora eburnea]|uniref:4207_t:CDS:1 n=1 Tax=Diversispora eburnea TaxID=1213867 RepID=A0A9N8YP22_9GLOM|nr:4207_t:CDS:2 [Diversispora eburnea]